MSDGERKLSPAEIAYPSAKSDGFVDHYVGQRRRSEPDPDSQPEPPNDKPPPGGKSAGPTPASKGRRFRWGFLFLAAVAAVGYLAQGRLGKDSNSKPDPKPSSEDVVLRIISEPPAHVYRRQLELGVTPLEVARDESGAELYLSQEGYQKASLTFEGASPGVVKEVRIKLEPIPSDKPPALPSPAAELVPPQASSLPTPRTTPVATRATPTPKSSPSPKPVEARPEPVAAQPPPPPPVPPVHQPPPRRAAPPPPPREAGGESHRIKPPDF